MKTCRLAALGIFASCLALVSAAFAADVAIDCVKDLGGVRPIHGINGGPVEQQTLIDLTAYHRDVRVPLTRLHDCNWPNPDVVDIHTLFPVAAADPDSPDSYDFVRTDEYVRAVLATGSKVVYRLGESIEHGKDKRRCAPPADTDKWASVCVHVVRHYNDGWAGGFKHDIRYWEIWNEPDNRPSCWTGTDDDYYRLYVTAAKAIKARFPDVKVGGPALGNVGKVDAAGGFEGYPFVLGLLDRCKRESAPLDFLSWHWYGKDPAEFAPRARGVRAMLDKAGFAKTESHLNEWNYLPDGDWNPVGHKGQGAARQRFLDRLGGPQGAAFVATALIHFQDLPIDQANFYSGSTQGFGMFSPAGEPMRNYFAFKAFAALAELPNRVSAAAPPGVAACAARSPDEVRVLLANFSAGDSEVKVSLKGLPWEGETRVEEIRIDEKDNWRVGPGRLIEGGELKLILKSPAVCLLKIKRP